MNGLNDAAWKAVRSALQIAQQGPEAPEARFIDALRTFGFAVVPDTTTPDPTETPPYHTEAFGPSPDTVGLPDLLADVIAATDAFDKEHERYRHRPKFVHPVKP